MAGSVQFVKDNGRGQIIFRERASNRVKREPEAVALMPLTFGPFRDLSVKQVQGFATLCDALPLENFHDGRIRGENGRW